MFLAMVLYLIGLWGMLFGPSALWVLSMLAFVMAAGSAVLISRHARRPVSGAIEGLGLTPHLKTACDLLLGVLIIIVVASFVTMLSSISDGVADFPIFQQQAHYTLNNHGHHTEVSRLRYCVAGCSFAFGWHGMGMALATFVLRSALTGDLSPFMPKRRSSPA